MSRWLFWLALASLVGGACGWVIYSAWLGEWTAYLLPCFVIGALVPTCNGDSLRTARSFALLAGALLLVLLLTGVPSDPPRRALVFGGVIGATLAKLLMAAASAGKLGNAGFEETRAS